MAEERETSNFIHNIIDKDLENKTYGDRPIYTRFPPEPNGYLHIGHAKSICLNFTTAEKYKGKCNLRFDDTNPEKEEEEYVESIKYDVQWLGFQWDKLIFASDYFDKMVDCAIELIKMGKAYVCDLTAEEIRQTRGTLTEAGVESPYRNRSVEENLRLFQGMKEGKYKDGEKVLRAKIDMASPNMNMRDPVIYRILHATHHNTGDKWCIYPMYDYAHPLEDAFEEITHSLCTLEFEDHRPLYEWPLKELNWPMPPQQIEFARLNLTNTVMSKRYLKVFVDNGDVEGWDDPRMPTIAGLRRRGYTPESIRDFADRIGVAKANSIVDVALLEFCIREDLKDKVESRMVVLDPLEVEITNYPEDKTEMMDVDGRMVPFSRHLYVEREDFMELPVKKYFRLFPGNEVRFKGAYFIICNEVVKDDEGNVTKLLCTYDPETRSGSGFDGRKVRGTIHWADKKTAIPLTVRLYDYLMLEDEEGNQTLNPNSVKTVMAMGEPSLKDIPAKERFQFFRQGYFIADEVLHKGEDRVYNRIVDLKSSFRLPKNK